LIRDTFLCFANEFFSISIILTVFARSIACLPNYLKTTQSFFSISHPASKSKSATSSLFW
jgi:hypothetical protein